MKIQLVGVFTAAFLPGVAFAQHTGQHAAAAPGSADLVQCARVQPAVDHIIAAAMTRLESSRLSNNAADMRATVDQLEASLRDIRAHLAPCAAAAAAAAPHAGMTMPAPQAPAAAPATAQPAAPVATDPHAGHAAPAAPSAAAKKSPSAPKPAPGKPASGSTADPHVGHATPKTPATAKSDPSKPAPAKPASPPPDDPHAGHATAGKPATKTEPSKTPGKSEQAETQRDPVNGLMVDPATAPKTTYQGQTYYFSSEQSKKEFLQNPAKFAKKPKG